MFVPFYLRSGVYTMPEFLERRYGPACRWYLTTVSIIAYVLTKIQCRCTRARRAAGGDGFDFYTSARDGRDDRHLHDFRRARAVIYTELLQAVVLIGGAGTLTVIGLSEVGGMAGLRAACRPTTST